MQICSNIYLRPTGIKFHNGVSNVTFKGCDDDKFCSPFVSGLKKISFLEPEHREFIYDFLGNSQKVSTAMILNVAQRLDKTGLEPQHKRNLLEHMMLKAEQDKERDLNKLVSGIELFSKNKDFCSMMISDASKYLLENPEVDENKYFDTLSEVNQKKKKKEIYPNIVKSAKLLYSKDYLHEYFEKGCSYYQLDFLGKFDNKFINKMKENSNITDFSIEERFEILDGINKSGTTLFNKDFNKIFPVLPKGKNEADEFVENIQTSIKEERPLIIDETKDKSVKNLAENIIENNKPTEEYDNLKFYKNLSAQILFDDIDISKQDKLFLSTIIKAYGYLKDKSDNLSQQKATLMLLDETSYKIMSEVLKDENTDELNKNIGKFTSSSKSLKQDTFTDINPKYIKIKHFADGTTNKVLDFNIIPGGNPNTFLHSTSGNIMDILPVYGKEANTNITGCIFSATYSNPKNEINPFRKYGVTLYTEDKNIIGGAEYDLATGYDKNIDNFAEVLFSDKFKNVRDFFEIKSQNADNKDISNSIKSTKRIDGRRYNEFLLLSPSITGVYGEDLEEIPYEYRKFAQDNDLFLIKLKNQGEKR